MKEGRWDRQNVDHAKQAELAAEAKRRGLSEATLEMSRAVPTDLVRDLVADFRTPPPGPSSIIKTDPKAETRRTTSTSEPRPLLTPYVSELDRVAESFAAEDRAKRAKELRELKGPSGGKR
jgi:hypothetical protein